MCIKYQRLYTYNSSKNMFKGLREDLGVLIIASSFLISLITADDVDSQTSYVPDLHLDRCHFQSPSCPTM